MKHGIISPKERESIPMIKLVVEGILGNPAYSDEILCTSAPGNPMDADLSVLYHKRTMESLTRRMGYSTSVIDEGLAVVYSELEDTDFAGIGISVGAGLTNVTLAYLTTPIISFSITRGGDWIDEQVSIATATPNESVMSTKESDFKLDSEAELGSVGGALSIYYDALITYIINNLKVRLSEVSPPEAEFPIALAGGSTMSSGFLDLFKRRLPDANLQVDISKIKMAKEPIFSVARGCLISALIKEKEGVAT